MKKVDTVIIGGGILGCMTARNLTRWNMTTVLIEEREDVCTGITRANAGVVYPGYDNRPGSRKAAMSVQGNTYFDVLCEELEVPFVRRGSFMVSFGPMGDKTLRKKYEHGLQNDAKGLELISGKEVCEREPFLASDATLALYAPVTGTVTPWELGIAAFENAVQNGCEPMLNTKVVDIQKTEKGYLVETDREMLECRVVLNCAGLRAERIQELLFPPSVRVHLDAADFVILDKKIPGPKHIIFQETEGQGKGITAVPTLEGNLLLSSMKRPLKGEWFSVDNENREKLCKMAARVFPTLEMDKVIRSFGSVRPNAYRVKEEGGQYVPDGSEIHSFAIEHTAPGFYSLIGIKTPGVTCADELGRYLARETAEYLDAALNNGFEPRRRAITSSFRKNGVPGEKKKKIFAEQQPEYQEIVCQCGKVSKGEILEAIRRGAVTVDGVKRRVGTGMGRCQGSRCNRKIEELLEEAGHGTV